MTPLEKADAARELLKNQAFKAVLRDTREELVLSLEQTPMTEFELQHEAVLMLQLLKRIETKLQRYVDDWKVEESRQKHQTFIERARQTADKVWRMR